jgi:hypothetical protein
MNKGLQVVIFALAITGLTLSFQNCAPSKGKSSDPEPAAQTAATANDTGSFTVSGATRDFNRTPSQAITAQDIGSWCNKISSPSVAGEHLSVRLGTVKDAAGNFSSLEFIVYNYAASKTSYSISAVTAGFNGGGTVALATSKDLIYSTMLTTTSLGPASTCTINVTTADGRVSGNFSCNKMYSTAQMLALAPVSGFTANGSFNCKLN